MKTHSSGISQPCSIAYSCRAATWLSIVSFCFCRVEDTRAYNAVWIMAVTSLASSDGASPVGDENLVGGGEFHCAQTIEDELDRDLEVVHRCSMPAADSPHAAGFRW